MVRQGQDLALSLVFGVHAMSKDQELFDGMARTIADQQEAIERVRELHKPVEASTERGMRQICQECWDIAGERLAAVYPCPTIKALDGEQG